MNAYIFIMTTGRLLDDRTMTTDRFIRRNLMSIRFKAANVVSTNPLTPPPSTRPSSNASPPIGTSMKTPYGAHSWPSLDSMRRSSPLILQQQLSQILCAPLPLPYRLPHPDQILHHFTTCIPFLCVPRIFLPTPN